MEIPRISYRRGRRLHGGGRRLHAAGVGYTGAGVGYTPLQQVHPLAPDSETEAENHFGQEYADRIKK